MNKAEVIKKCIDRFGSVGEDPLNNVPHSYPSVDDWEKLQTEMQIAISKELGFEVTVGDDASVMWHYDEEDELTIGWVESTEYNWTYQGYDAIALKMNNEDRDIDVQDQWWY